MENNNIKNMYLVNLHLNSTKGVTIQNYDHINATIHATYGFDQHHILFVHIKVHENDIHLYSIKCQYRYDCNNYESEKQLTMDALEYVSDQLKEFVGYIVTLIDVKTN